MNLPKLDPCGSVEPQKEKRYFYGKFRGVVFDNNDPWQLGRIQAKVEEIFGKDPSGWALPCVPYAGKGVGLFLIPPKDALVWIEFENGDPDYPIWSGCFWADEKASNIVPAKPYNPDIKILKTDIGKIEINDSSRKPSITIEAKIGRQTMNLVMNSSGIEIKCGNAKGAFVKLNDSEIEINNGKSATVELKLNKVSINNFDLEVI
ncbi:phage baseplate assembly protein V [Nostoc sp. CHAB 5784]|uniref:phage baseplate assembly protein V n=1 Tax=Nostoc mirabile TaxID=2907820 RepID=UPI001E3AD88F|nr:phage baseplate assembly protein V [Nostoc mirabile]MCC5667898.1 phage baseplate assembly protein V [Nostoc mirabile CHAB5784]